MTTAGGRSRTRRHLQGSDKALASSDILPQTPFVSCAPPLFKFISIFWFKHSVYPQDSHRDMSILPWGLPSPPAFSRIQGQAGPSTSRPFPPCGLGAATELSVGGWGLASEHPVFPSFQQSMPSALSGFDCF